MCAWILTVAACGLLAAPRAQAAERIVLRNGFELNCDHRGVPSQAEASASSTAEAGANDAAGADASVGGTAHPAGTAHPYVRLYLDAAEANYLDVEPGDILKAEQLPPEPAALVSPPPQRSAKTGLSPAELRELLASAGAEHDLDVDLLASLVHAESGSQVHAVSAAGAQGLMQLMPGTAARLGVKDSFEPEANVHGGTAYLDSLLKRYHDNLALALAAYNAGPGAVDRYHGVPPYRETRAYVARIIHEFNQRYSARQAAASLAMAR
jgi:soluble lytic murein transglycosylase-like protein